MMGYEILLMLYSEVETRRNINIPKDITFKQLHTLIQKVFGFDDYHNYEFQIPRDIPDEDVVDLNDIEKTIGYSDAEDVKISEIFDEKSIALYLYDFGDSWEIVVHKLNEIEYDYKTAVITDYAGKYNPMDDMGGIFVFEEIMQAIEDEDDIEYILDEYGLKKSDLTKMDFEKKYKIGSKIRI